MEKENKEADKALDKALFFILRRPHSEKELELKLSKRFSETSIKKAFGKLREYGYLDDKRFTKSWINDRKKFKPKGKRGLFFELIKKGVEKEIIEKELSKIEEGEEIKEAAELIKRKYQKYLDKKLNYEEKIDIKKKMYSFLASRGYEFGVVKTAIEELLNE